MKPFKSLAEKAALENRVYKEAKEMLTEIHQFVAMVEEMNQELEDERLANPKSTIEIIEEIKACYDYAKIATIPFINMTPDANGKPKVFFEI